jgi:hypothetical protein
MNFVSESQSYKNITSTTTVYTGACGVLGIFVASASSTPTIKVSDGLATVVNTFTPVAATFYPIPARVGTSLVVTISGTVDCTVFWTNQ